MRAWTMRLMKRNMQRAVHTVIDQFVTREDLMNDPDEIFFVLRFDYIRGLKSKTFYP